MSDPMPTPDSVAFDIDGQHFVAHRPSVLPWARWRLPNCSHLT